MANKQALRELQSRLAERLQAARTQERGKSWLAVECSARGFLFPLRDAGEIFPVAPLAPVPHSHPWFLGVSNLRGHLHGVVDLGGFLGLNGHGGPREQSRLVGFNHALDINCVLLVDRLSGGQRSSSRSGLRSPDRDPASPAHATATPRRGSGRS